MSDMTPQTPEPTVPPAPAAPAAAPAPAYGAAPRTNTLAIVALILAFVVSLGGVICGFIALSQIRRTGEGGHGLALAAVIIGFVGIALGIVWIIVAIAIGIGGSSSYYYG